MYIKHIRWLIIFLTIFVVGAGLTLGQEGRTQQSRFEPRESAGPVPRFDVIYSELPVLEPDFTGFGEPFEGRWIPNEQIWPDDGQPATSLAISSANPTWQAFSQAIIRWQIDSQQAAVCQTVDISLSVDGGQRYPYRLATSVANTGQHTVDVPYLLPQGQALTGHIRVTCTQNDYLVEYAVEDATVTLDAENCPTSPFNQAIPDGDVEMLIWAIDCANTTPETDTITLDPDGVYGFDAANNTFGGPNALPVISTPIRLVGGTTRLARSQTAINSAIRMRFAYVVGGGHLTLNGITVEKMLIAGSGAAINVSGGRLDILNSTLKNNTSESMLSGGAINIINGGGNTASASIVNTTFTNNTAYQGGAMSLWSGALLFVTNSTFVDNTATFGGAIWSRGDSFITSSTFYSNAATTAGDQLRQDTETSRIMTVSNSIVAFGDGVANNCDGNITDGGYNIESDATCSFDGGNSLQNTDPLLETMLADNGGLSMTLALSSASPAIDLVPTAACNWDADGDLNTPVTALLFDQRGVGRLLGAGCDVGAYEYSPVCSELISGTPAQNTADLIYLIDCANADPDASTINLIENGTYTLDMVHNMDNGASGLPTILTPITINGHNATIQRSTQPSTPDFRHFFIDEGGHLILNHITLAHGKSDYAGGAIFSDGGDLTLNDSTIRDNDALEFGGGIWIDDFDGDQSDAPSVIITNSTFTDNHAANDSGGGLGIQHGMLTLTNSTFVNNEGEFGGGLWSNATTNINFSTFTDNAANFTGDNLRNYTDGVLTVSRSIVDKGNGTAADCTGTFIDGGYNLESGSICGFTTPTSLQNIDPLLNSLANNGGPTQTISLQDNSPARNHIPLGNCVWDADGDGVSSSNLIIDQRGEPRPRDVNCDSGAFEAAPINCPTSPFVYNVQANNTAELIRILDCSNNDPSTDTINLASGATYFLVDVFSYEAMTANGLPPITGGLLITGQDTIIRRVGGANTPEFRLLKLLADSDVVIDGITFVNGYTTEAGGAVLNEGGVLQVLNSQLMDNTATDGAGIATIEGHTAMFNSTIDDNTALNSGGGLYNAMSTLTVTNSTIANNVAEDGGGIWSNDTTSLNFVTLYRNSANTFGDNLARDAGTFTVRNSIVAFGNGIAANCSGTFVDGGYNIETDTTCNFNSGTSLQSTDPLFADAGLTDNGGTTPTILIDLASPAAELVPMSSCLYDADSNPSTPDVALSQDQRGFARPIGVTCDAGALERSIDVLDSDGDHLISPVDAIFVINRIGNTPTGDDAAADVNGDGVIDAMDVNLVLAYLGGVSP